MRGLVFLLAAVAAAAPAARAGDPRAGEALFVGQTRLANGGAPCLGCHGLAGHGLAWSASFGPDLSTLPATYDAPTLAGVLEDVPFPSMVPIYRAHALTPAERDDLATFLLGAPAAAPKGHPRAELLLEAGAVAAAILAALVLLARRRMPPVRDALAARRAAGGSP